MLKDTTWFEKEGFIPIYEIHDGGILSTSGEKIYFLGIIDILTEFGGKKRMEYISKAVFYGEKMSCIPP